MRDKRGSAMFLRRVGAVGCSVPSPPSVWWWRWSGSGWTSLGRPFSKNRDSAETTTPIAAGVGADDAQGGEEEENMQAAPSPRRSALASSAGRKVGVRMYVCLCMCVQLPLHPMLIRPQIGMFVKLFFFVFFACEFCVCIL